MSYPTSRPDARPVWTKSSRSANVASCVETAVTPEGVLVRDSTDPQGPHLAFSRAAWAAFLAGVKAGEFDREPDGPAAPDGT